jgi:hypothetical protein
LPDALKHCDGLVELLLAITCFERVAGLFRRLWLWCWLVVEELAQLLLQGAVTG